MKKIIESQMLGVKVEKMIAAVAALFCLLSVGMIFFNPFYGMIAAFMFAKAARALYTEAKTDEERLQMHERPTDEELEQL